MKDVMRLMQRIYHVEARRGGLHILTNVYYYAFGNACDHRKGSKVSWRTQAAAIHSHVKTVKLSASVRAVG